MTDIRGSIRQILCRRGSAMTEAAISLPVVILAAMLMLRMFTFYLEILTTGIEEHRKALEAQDSYRGAALRIYRSGRRVEMLKGGLLMMDVGRDIEVKAYMVNEDMLVRGSELFR